MLEPLFEVRRYQSVTVTHSHDFHQVVLPLSGGLEMEIGGLRGEVQAARLALIAAGQAHSFTGSRGNAFLVLDLPVQTSTAFELGLGGLWDRARSEPFVELEPSALSLVEYVAMASERGQLRATLAQHACALLLGAVAVQLGIGEDVSWPRSLRSVVGYIDAHLAWPLTVAELAAAGAVSASRLHALFRLHLATTPQRYVSQRRLERAAGLLSHTALPVLEIAERVGYGDQAAFTRAFKRHTGKTPRGWRAGA